MFPRSSFCNHLPTIPEITTRPSTSHKALTYLLLSTHLFVDLTTALSWEKHANTICTRFTSSPSLEKALSLCQQHGPSKCAGVYASNCDSGTTMLCQPQTIEVSSSKSTSSCIHTSACREGGRNGRCVLCRKSDTHTRTHAHANTHKYTQIHTQLLNRLLPSLCGDTVKTTSTCGMPDIGKKFKSGQKYTLACKDCATECFEGSLDHTRISRHVCRKRGIDSNLPPMYKAYACVHHQPQLYT